MQVVVVLDPEAVQVRQGLRSVGGGEDVRSAVARRGLRLEPMHAGTTDPSLQTYFTIDVPDRTAAEDVIDMLRRHPSVQGAYLKPADEAP